MCTERHVQSTENKKFAYLCNISRNTWRMKLIFCLTDKQKVSSNWDYHFRCVWQYISKSPKIRSLLFLWKILRKNWVIKLIFLQMFSTNWYYDFDGDDQTFPKSSTNEVCSVFSLSVIEGTRVRTTHIKNYYEVYFI